MMKREPPTPLSYYKRVIVAVRLKSQHKLTLKLFKDIPTGALEQLLPSGRIHMTGFDRAVVTTMAFAGITGMLIKGVAWLADVNVQWSLIVTVVASMFVVRGFASYMSRRNRLLHNLSRMLYNQQIASNRGVLTLAMDRAHDEAFKEALLVYCTLLAERPQPLSADSTVSVGEDFGGLTAVTLARKIESWLRKHAETDVSFDCNDSVRMLESFGILSRVAGTSGDEFFRVLALQQAAKQIPKQRSDILTESFDEKDAIETFEKGYRSNETDIVSRSRRSEGWW